MSDGNTRDLRLGEKLWKQIEKPQGLSFVADDVVTMPDGAVLEFIHNILPHARKAVRILESFDKKYKFGESEEREK